MPSCSNSSNLLGNVNISDLSNSGARLLMTHPISGFSGGVSDNIGDDGVTAGDVIRYDVIPDSPSVNLFTKASADVAQYSEVVGVIETITNDVVNVVLSGQIKFPEGRFATAENDLSRFGGGSGGNDVYFLSAATAGAVQNLAPYISGQIAKPVLQVVNDGLYNAHVVNYIGYQIGGPITGSFDMLPVTGTVAQVLDLNAKTNDINGRDGWFNVTSGDVRWLALSVDAEEYVDRTYNEACTNFFGDGRFGKKYEVELEEVPRTDMLGKTITQKNGRVPIFNATVTGVDRTLNKITIVSTYVNSSKVKVNIDPSIPIYHGTVQYNPLASKELAFALPRYNSPPTRTSLKDINNTTLTLDSVYVMFVVPDNCGRTLYVGESVSMMDLVVNNKATFITEDGLYEVDDLAGAVQKMSVDIAAANAKLGLTTTTVSITET